MNALNLILEYKFGGGEKVAQSYATILNELGYTSKVLGIKSDRVPKDDSVILVKNRWAYFSYLIRNYASYNLFFCHCNFSLIILIFISMIKRKNNKTFFYIQHLEYSEKKRIFLYKLINIFFDYYIEIKSCSYKELCMIDERKILKIHNFALAHKSNDNGMSPVLKKYKSAGFKLFLFVGAAKNGKGLNHLIMTAIALNNINCKYKIVFVGDGPLLSDFQKDVERNGLSDYFIFCGYCESPYGYMEISDILLFTSDKSEVTPMVVIESLVNKLPVLAFNLPFNRRYLTSDCLFNVGDYIGMAEYLESGRYVLEYCNYDSEYAIKEFSKILEI